ncbi:MAG: hypothetical protein Q4B62_09400 [Clostridiaceae bacterium]|nr:hypothetical protein [Clostridiaceae bacterium]
MKTRIKLTSILLAVCMVLTLIPTLGTVVFAEGETSCHVSTEQELTDAVKRADKTKPYTIYLDSDITTGRQDIYNQALTIDLCGHAITGTANSNVLFTVYCSETYLSEHSGGSKLTVKDSKGGGTITYPVGKFSSISSLFSTSEKSTLVIESGTFILTAAEEGNHGHIVDCYGESTVDINGGVFRNETGYESRMGNSCIWIDSGKLTVDNAKLYSSSQCIYIRATDPTSVEVKNCSFEHGMDAINIDNGTLTIGNSLFTATKDNAYAIHIRDLSKVGYISDCLASGNNAYVDGELYTQTNGSYLGNTTAGSKVEIGPPRITIAWFGVDEPTIGATPQNHCGTGTYDYTGGSVKWTPADATFKEGVAYTATFTGDIDYFDGVFAYFVDVYLNGNKATLISGGGTEHIVASYTFPAMKATENISSASLNVSAPVTGATPAAASTTDTQYTVANTSWEPVPDGKFAETTAYEVVISLEANPGYQFASDTAFRINGKNASVISISAEEARISYSFPATESSAKKIASASLNISAPVTGATPSAASTTDTQYTIANTSWEPVPGGKFAETTAYEVVISLEAKSGYRFTAGTAFRINGKNASVISLSAEEARISYSFPATLAIPTVAIRNNPGNKTVNYGDGIFFRAVTTDLPSDAQIKWYVNGAEKATGELFSYSDIKSNSTVTVKLTNADGTPIKNADGEEISDSETINVKAGFFQKLASFFKNLFGIGRITVQTIKAAF